MKRLFIALEIPENIKEAIAKEQEQLNNYFYSNLVDKEKMHITLLFLGDTKLEENKIIDKIKEIKVNREITIYGIDAFPSLESPRIVFKKIEPDLKDIHEQLCKELGINETGFTAHLTLCRVKKVLKKIDTNIFSNKFYFKADKLSLFNSDFKNYYKLF